MTETQIVITIKQDGKITTEEMLNNGNDAEACDINYLDNKEITEDEAERYVVASDLANVCDYLEDSEVIKIKLIIQKAQKRKERNEQVNS